ncbi:MAG: ABC transporter ATP-binding protein [Deltaproteobacteria bacterium]|nr:ABC transporter ATP-binding protein [Deltaproteobacteria bacterium]
MIVAEHLTKYYGERAAVDDVSFIIKQGEVVGLLGLNGAGKTTILRILSGLLVPTSGRVSIAGVDLAANPEEVRAHIGFLPEQPPLYPEMTVTAFLAFVARIKGLRKNIAAAVREALEVTDLVAVADDRIGTLSHGYMRRVGIAQAVVHRPPLVLLDEPTSGLDPVQIVHMRKLIRSLAGNHTVIVSSHILGEIHQLCDRILVVKQGRIAAEGAEEELAGKVATATVVKVEVRGDAAQLATVLKGLPLVSRHTVNREAAGVTEATIEMTSDGREALSAAVIRAGLGLRRLERVTLELESIFLELTGGQQPEVRS